MAYTTIPKPSAFFTPKLYTGNGSSQTITGLNFQPDLTWIKVRDDTESNGLYDAVRGALYRIQSNSNSASTSVASTVTGWTSDGFSLGADNEVNGNGKNYVGWNWKANGLGSSNTDGTINSIYTSANTTSGFSIVQFTGTGANATVGHGLGVAPTVIITRPTSQSGTWRVFAEFLGNTQYLTLNTTAAQATGSTMWNGSPTNQVFTLGSSGDTNGSGVTFISYCFAEKKGFSKFGTYTGQGGSGEPFIYTGFKPAFIITRNITSAVNWGMFDDKRNPFNVVQNVLLPDNSAAETTGTAKHFDFLSNGFKVKNDSLQYNGTNETHVYLAFAEEPLVSTNGNAATAR